MRRRPKGPNEDPAPRTKLEYLRRECGIRQDELAEAVGIPVATYQRLERRQMRNPPLLYLMNCAMALDVPLDMVIEEDWWEWHKFPGGHDEPPPPDWWRTFDYEDPV